MEDATEVVKLLKDTKLVSIKARIRLKPSVLRASLHTVLVQFDNVQIQEKITVQLFYSDSE